MNEENFHKELFGLAQYLISSAETLENEPKDYGPLRLLEVSSRLLKLIDSKYGDSFAGRIVEEIDKNKDLVMTNQDKFYNFIHDLVIKFAHETKNRG